MTLKNYCFVSGVLFVLVALLHLVRVVIQADVVVDGFAVPMYISWFGFLVPAALAAWAFRLAGSDRS